MNNLKKQKYFHCYATANDSRFYLKDIQNLMRLKNYYSGFETVVLFIAISKVNEITAYDDFFVNTVYKIFDKHPSIDLREVYYKSNLGRDFSSFELSLKKLRKEADIDDFVLFQNRSGRGPFSVNWYKDVVNQYKKFDSIAICGSTINFNDHPERSKKTNLPHVQTYMFLSTLRYLNMLGDTFPGSDKSIKLDIICYGEIELSQFFLRKGYKITCMEWPNEEISSHSKPIVSRDIKDRVIKKHQFYHRLYFRKNLTINIVQAIPNLRNFIKFIYYALT